MPAYEIALPPGAKNIKIKTSTQEIPVEPTFYRHSKDGAIPIVALFGGDEFVGEVLEGQWGKKGFESGIQSAHIKLDKAGKLEFQGATDDAATPIFRESWLNGQIEVLLLDDLTIDIHLKLSGYTSKNRLNFNFYLSDADSGLPYDHSNYLRVCIQASTTVYEIFVQKKVNGTRSSVLDWTSVTNGEGTFRIKFEENKSGHNHTHIYFHDGAGEVDESKDEVSGSPFSLGLAIEKAYPHFEFRSQDDTVQQAWSDFVRVTYPDFKAVYDLDDDAYQGEGEELLKKAWDTSGNGNHGTIHEAKWIRLSNNEKALKFEGKGYVDCGNDSSLNPSQFTVVIKACKLGETNESGNDLHFVKKQTGGNGFVITQDRFYLYSGGSSTYFMNPIALESTPRYYGYIFDGSTAKTYKEKELIDSGSGAFTPATTAKFYISALNYEANGIISEVYFYKRALSEEEYFALVDGNPPTDGLVGEWKFDGGNNRGEIIVWDTMGSDDEDDWVRVYDPSHKFVGDCVVENGLIRIWIHDGVSYGFDCYLWNGDSWSKDLDVVKFYTTGKELRYPFFKGLKNVSTDQAKLEVKFVDTSVDDADYFIEAEVTLKRGQYNFELNITNVYPADSWTFGYFELSSLGIYRFGYAGDNEIGDNNLSVSARNSVMSDNFALIFDPNLNDVLVCCSAIEKPSNQKEVYSGRAIRFFYYSNSDLPMKGHLCIVPFSKVANLFKEAEDETLSSGAQINKFADDFSVDSSGQYTAVQGTVDTDWVWDTSNGELDHPTSSVGLLILNALQFGNGTYQVDGIAREGSGVANESPAIVFGYEDSSNFYLARLRWLDTDQAFLELLKYADASWTTLASKEITTSVSRNTWYRLKVTWDPSTGSITVELYTTADVLIDSVSATDTAFTSGQVGIRAYMNSSFDNFDIRAEEVESSGNSAVILDAQGDQVRFKFTGIDDLPKGRYIAFIRAKDTAHAGNDFRVVIFPEGIARYLNEENGHVYKTITGSYSYYGYVFDLTDDEEGLTIAIEVYKNTTSVNSICVDYCLIVPIGNGESWPQDIAHNVMRTASVKYRVFRR